ncbi:unnamed protein product [Jaminaea pallidilutea]
MAAISQSKQGASPLNRPSASPLAPLSSASNGHGLSPNPSGNSNDTGAPSPSSKTVAAGQNNREGVNAADISSPHELTDWVDSLLDDLETRFNEMQSSVEVRFREMERRVDQLEAGVERLVQGSSSGM